MPKAPWTATQALKTALISLYLQGDMAAAIYYGSIVGNGKVEAGEPEAGIKYCETAKGRIVTGSFVAARQAGETPALRSMALILENASRTSGVTHSKWGVKGGWRPQCALTLPSADGQPPSRGEGKAVASDERQLHTQPFDLICYVYIKCYIRLDCYINV